MSKKTFIKRSRFNREKEPPPTQQKNLRPWRVAVLANLHCDHFSADEPPDKGGDYDSMETITRICNAIRNVGHNVRFIPADRNLPQAIIDFKPDMCFNISEGLNGDSREAQVPAFLELMGIPYTGSRVLTNALALDKPLTKKVWAAAGLPVAFSQTMTGADEPLDPSLVFPLIVKPAREGSGMGLHKNSLVQNETELRHQVDRITRLYRQPALIEQFLPGREFTVGVMGRPGAQLRRPDLYNEDGYRLFPIAEIFTPDSGKGYSFCDYNIKSVDADTAVCPADISDEFRDKLYDLVLRAHKSLECTDISRTDIRCDEHGNPFLLEINPLPGLSKNSHIPTVSRASGMSFEELVLEILYLGSTRYGIQPVVQPPVRNDYYQWQYSFRHYSQATSI